ncbi:hypothetical protein ACN28C_31645 [Plantactinospora sp. WMMC1484]|uniref:hypothetical protein n=1 Tax=Plantactinospora sp. WMMC1484 TaxID=3404122 RepID=UPI003BF603AE
MSPGYSYRWGPRNTRVADAPEPPASIDREDPEFKGEVFRLDLAIIEAREAAERLAYHLVNDQLPEEPEMCDEFKCSESCSGRHETSHVDCGPDVVFDDLDGEIFAQSVDLYRKLRTEAGTWRGSCPEVISVVDWCLSLDRSISRYSYSPDVVDDALRPRGSEGAGVRKSTARGHHGGDGSNPGLRLIGKSKRQKLSTVGGGPACGS